MLALAFLYYRRQQHEARALRQGHNMIDHLTDGLGIQGDVVVGAARLAHARVQQAQVIVDFGHRAHGGARIVRGGFLFYGNGRAQALDQVHIGFFHDGQELARIRRQRFHVAALALGV